MPGCLLVEYALCKWRQSLQRRRLHLEAAAALEGGPQLEGGGSAAPPIYRLWTSKLFAAGVLLLIMSAGVLALTLLTVWRPAAAAR